MLFRKIATNGTFSEVYSGPYQTSKMELFAKTVIRLKLLNVFAKNSFLEIFKDIKYHSDFITV